jgi:hypothetical protein
MPFAPNGTTIQGVVDAGQNVAGFPVSMGFKDASGKNQYLTGDLLGNLNVNVAAGSVTISGAIAGGLTNNNAPPGANNLGVLPAIANAAAPSWAEGNQVLLSVDRAGNLRSIAQGFVASGSSLVGVNPVAMGMNGAGAVARFLTEANALASTTGTGLLGVGAMPFDGVNYQKMLGDTSGRVIVVGAAASGAALAGNPVLVAGSDGTNAVSLKIGTGSAAGLLGTFTAGTVVPSDTAANSGFSGLTGSGGSTGGITAAIDDFNGTTWDRHRNNTDVTLLASASRTTTQTSADITCYNLRGINVILDMTVVGTGSVTVSIDGKDPASGKYYNLLTGAAIGTNSTNVYKIGEALTAVANAVVNDRLPRTIRIVVTANNANPATYSVGYSLLV